MKSGDHLNLPAILLHPAHVAGMGKAVWVYLWLWRRLGSQARIWGGQVPGVVTTEDAARELGIPRRTVERHLASLREREYILTEQAGHGLKVEVNLWNPEQLAISDSELDGMLAELLDRDFGPPKTAGRNANTPTDRQ